MDLHAWWSELQNRIEKFDLLRHPFYVAWSMGELTREEIAAYAANYYHQVKTFPAYLAELEERLPEGSLKERVRQNRLEEQGHAEIWLDFAQGMGCDRQEVESGTPSQAMSDLMEGFFAASRTASPAEALTRFFVYESQVPRIAAEKGRWLGEIYKTDAKTKYYFTLHESADVKHAEVWRKLIESQITDASAELSLRAGEDSARALWKVLDEMQAKRERQAASVC